MIHSVAGISNKLCIIFFLSDGIKAGKYKLFPNKY